MTERFVYLILADEFHQINLDLTNITYHDNILVIIGLIIHHVCLI